MASDWQRVRISDLIEFTRDGEWGTNLLEPNRVEMLVIRGSDFSRLRVGDLDQIPRRYIERSAADRKQLRADDILIETAGGTKDRPTGRTALLKAFHIENAPLPMTCASFARLVRFNHARVHPPFMYWWLQHLHASGEMERHQVQHTGVARFQFTKFVQGTEVALPPLAHQIAVAKMLDTFDEKLELNRRMSQNLEQIARGIFKSWFLQPSHDRRAGRLGDECEITMGQSPPGDTYNETGEGSVFYQGRTDFGFRYPRVRVYCTQPTRFANEGDTLLSVRAPVGSTNMAARRCAIGRGVAALRHKSRSRSYTYYLAQGLDSVLEPFEGEGTVFGSIGRSDLAALPVIVPEAERVIAFEERVRSLDDRIELNEREANTLVKLRDSLLSALVTGRLRPDRGVSTTGDAVARS